MEKHSQKIFAISGDSEQELNFTCKTFDLEMNKRDISILAGIIGGHKWSEQ